MKASQRILKCRFSIRRCRLPIGRATPANGCVRALAVCAGCLLLGLNGSELRGAAPSQPSATAAQVFADAGLRPVSLSVLDCRDPALPRELSKVSLPSYRIEPPDVLQIEATRLIPRQPYRLDIYDVTEIRAAGTLPDHPLYNYYLIDADGTVNLGPAYGKVVLLGLSLEEAEQAITDQLKKILAQPRVSVRMARSGAIQQLSGPREVDADGTINLGMYGTLYVSGMTVAEASTALEKQMAHYFDGPKLGLSVMRYASKKYYVIVAGAGAGEGIRRFSSTGNETVLDAIAAIQGVPPIASGTMWIVRPGPAGAADSQVLPIDFESITAGGSTATNYQLLPGDRLYIIDDKLIATDNYLARVTGPMRRMFSLSLLSTGAIRNLQTLGRRYNLTR